MLTTRTPDAQAVRTAVEVALAACDDVEAASERTSATLSVLEFARNALTRIERTPVVHDLASLAEWNEASGTLQNVARDLMQSRDGSVRAHWEAFADAVAFALEWTRHITPTQVELHLAEWFWLTGGDPSDVQAVRRGRYGRLRVEDLGDPLLLVAQERAARATRTPCVLVRTTGIEAFEHLKIIMAYSFTGAWDTFLLPGGVLEILGDDLGELKERVEVGPWSAALEERAQTMSALLQQDSHVSVADLWVAAGEL